MLLAEPPSDSQTLLWIGGAIVTVMAGQWALLAAVWGEIKDFRRELSEKQDEQQKTIVDHEVRIVRIETVAGGR